MCFFFIVIYLFYFNLKCILNYVMNIFYIMRVESYFLLIEYFYNVLNDCFYIEIGGILYFYMWYYDIYVYIGNIFNFKIMRCNKVWLVF